MIAKAQGQAGTPIRSAVRRGDGSSSTHTSSPNGRSYRKDANGSVLALEGDTGDVPNGERYDYDPYGQVDVDPTDAEAAANPFRFEGFYYDSGIKSYDMHARSYRAEHGRFLSQDRYASASQDLLMQTDVLTQNRYVFGGANPVGNVEFDGHKAADCIYACPLGRAPTETEKRKEKKFWEHRVKVERRSQQTVDDEAAAGAAASALADEVAHRYCAGRNLCGSEKFNANKQKVLRALLAHKELADIELERESTDVGILDPFNLAVGGGTGAAATAIVKGAGRRAAGFLAGVLGGSARTPGLAAGREGIRQVVERTAQAQTDMGRKYLLRQLSRKELAAIDEEPQRIHQFMGSAVHRQTKKSLEEMFPGRFKYNPNRGPDFEDTVTGQKIELTTPGQVAKHRARGGDYTTADMATYTLPKQ